ncbi:ankyrin, partial [Lepidopterella palustris CBS 459.81]
DPTLPAFLAACTAGDLELVKRLAQGRDPNDDSLIYGAKYAGKADHVDVLRYLLDNGASWDNMDVISSVNSIAAFEVLVDHGFDVNQVLPFGDVPLPNIVGRNDVPLLHWFLDHGANPNLGIPLYRDKCDAPPDQNSGCALNVAANCSTPAVFDLLLDRGARIENSIPLHRAAESSDRPSGERIPMMEHLIKLGIDVNGDDHVRGMYSRGKPLKCAAEWGRIVEVKFLLEHGADPFMKSAWGRSAMD